MGDVLGIVDGSGNIIVSYRYNAWGLLIDPWDSNTTTANALAENNSLRYRGYCYDSDLGMYYLQSRFYDPTLCRFVNADEAENISADGSFLGYNLYAYCGNNPIRYEDSGGEVLETAFDVASLVLSIAEVVANPADPLAWAGLVGDAVDLIPFVTGVGETIRVLKATSKFAEGTDAAIDTYRNLKKVNAGTGNEVHHIIEKRFAEALGIKKENSMLSTALSQSNHRDYTNAWRRALPYGKKYEKQDILNAAAHIYSTNPQMMGAALFTILYDK